jgi:hypothetical protein
MKTTIEKRVPLTIGTPPLYVLFSTPAPAHRTFGPSWLKEWELVAKVHVISPAAGGEVRGYWLTGGCLYLAYPLYPERWEELDAEVSMRTGLTIRDPPLRQP